MFRKSDGVKPAEPVQRDPVPPAAKYADVPLPPPHAGPGPGGNVATGSSVSIGKTVSITGQLSGSEDLTLDGQVEGRIDLPQNVLTVGVSGRIKAEIFAKVVVVHGHVTGNIAAAERIEIRESGQVQGDIVAPRIAIADGAQFKGSIDMQRTPAAVPAAAAAATPAPAAPASPAKAAEKPSTAQA